MEFNDQSSSFSNGRKRNIDSDIESSDELAIPLKKTKQFIPVLPYTISQIFKDKTAKSMLGGRRFRIEFNGNLPVMTNILATLYKTFENIITEVLSEFPPTSKVHIVLQSHNLEHHISIKMNECRYITPEYILSSVEETLQSREEIPLGEGFTVDINVFNSQIGSGLQYLHSETKLKKYCVTTPKDNDASLARSIVVALAKANNDPRYRYIIDSRRPLQRKLAEKLHHDAGVPFGACGYGEAEAFAAYLDIQINVIDFQLEQELLSFGDGDSKTKIFLWRYIECGRYHYDAITSYNSFKKINIQS